MSAMTARSALKDENGLILPRKITNPCLESLPVKDIQREMKWNKKKGINLLDNKSELQKALEKHKNMTKQKVKEDENNSGSDFEKVLAARAERLLKFETEENVSPGEKGDIINPDATVPHHDVDQSQTPRENKLTGVSGQLSNLTFVTNSGNNRRDKNRNAGKCENLKLESVDGGDGESEFAKVFAQLRGEKRWD